MKILVTGASGFVGRHTVAALLRAGHDVVGMSRDLPGAERHVPGAAYVTGDVTNPATLTPDKLMGCDAVVHLVGIIQEVPRTGQTFEVVHTQGTKNLLAAAKEAGVTSRFVYLSAIGSAPDAPSRYSVTKAAAEQAVRDSGLPFTIFRPSIILGPDGDFVRQMEELLKKPPGAPFAPPFIPVPGSGQNRFQPLWIGDLMDCIIRCLTEPGTVNQTYELGGATQVTFDALLQAFERHRGIKKPLLHLPMPLMFAAASVFEKVLPRPPITNDQLLNLRQDNICDNGPIRAALGIDPLPFEQALAKVYAAKSSGGAA